MTENIQLYLSEFKYIVPELIIAIGIVVIIALDLIFYNKAAFFKTALALITILSSSLSLIYLEPVQSPVFYNTLNPNQTSIFFRLLADFSMFVVLLFWQSTDSDNKNVSSEYPFLWLSVLFAAHFLCISNHWLMVFLSIEMLSISSYILLGIGFRKVNIEAAFKYLVFGALSSGIMVFGISLILADIQNLYFSGFEFSYLAAFEELNLMSIGLLMAFAGIFFKLSLFPFHFWVPDVYQGSSLPFMLMVASIPKIAAFGFFCSQFLIIWPNPLEYSRFSHLVAILGIISIVWGNLSALRQDNFARLFAYSSIAQAGFMILALVNGFEGILKLEIFLALYVFMNIIVFITASQINNRASDLKVSDFAGLGGKNIFYALAFLLAMMALIGLPPTGGFTAKFVILSGLFEWYSSVKINFRLTIFILAMINVIISLFYYLKIPYFMFFKSNEKPLKAHHPINLILILISIAILIWSFIFFSAYKELIIDIGADII